MSVRESDRQRRVTLPTLLSCVRVPGSKRDSVDSQWADSRGVRGPVSALNKGAAVFSVSLGPLGLTHWTGLSDTCGFTRQ